jgi:hypothetical protein
MITRSGSNDWHGNLRWYNRNTATAANSFFNNRINLPKPELRRNIGGGSLGGPIAPGRAFFFADVEARRDSSEESVLRSVPTQSYRSGVMTYRNTAGAVTTLSGDAFRAIDPLNRGVNPAVLQYFSLFPDGNDSSAGDGFNSIGYRFNTPVLNNTNIYTARLDYNLSSDGRHSLFARGTLGDIKRDLLPPQFPDRSPNAVLLNNSKGVAVGYTALIGSTMVNSAQVSLTRPGIEQTGSTAGRWFIASPTIDSIAGADRAVGRRVPQWELKDDFTWSSGSHLFQVGGNGRFISNHLFN